MNILVTGGAGYIGSHTIIELLAAGHSPVIVDNFSNSMPEVLNRLKRITGQSIPFYEMDVRDQAALEAVLRKHKIEAGIHFAAYKAVGESVAEPAKYYDNNIMATLAVAGALVSVGAKKLIFSSSSTVYGKPEKLPYPEDHPKKPESPYGHTKLMGEQILSDIAAADKEWSMLFLRYFNPVGAHNSGLIGEDPEGIPNNLMPYIAQVATGRREKLAVFGNDYPTADGTGVRDYIHVVDLAKAHVAALEHTDKSGAEAFNIGTGRGNSVLEIVTAFEKASGKSIPYDVVARRPGDIAEYYGDPAKAERKLGWKAELGLAEMCEDTWRWQSQNPNGYDAS